MKLEKIYKRKVTELTNFVTFFVQNYDKMKKIIMF